MEITYNTRVSGHSVYSGSILENCIGKVIQCPSLFVFKPDCILCHTKQLPPKYAIVHFYEDTPATARYTDMNYSYFQINVTKYILYKWACFQTQSLIWLVNGCCVYIYINWINEQLQSIVIAREVGLCTLFQHYLVTSVTDIKVRIA